MKHDHPLRDFEPEELRLPKDLCIKLSVDHYKTCKRRPDIEESLCREVSPDLMAIASAVKEELPI